jgi:ribonucleoside-diphosphate reductase alpha chain
MDAFGTAISLCLQYGVPLRVLCRKFSHTRFEPSGFTKDPEIPMAKSLVDYIFRWLENTFPEEDAQNGDSCADTVSVDADPVSLPQDVEGAADVAFQHFMQDAPICDQCGAITVRNGSCYRCHNCGNSMGCS